jgi:hypothetical protein
MVSAVEFVTARSDAPVAAPPLELLVLELAVLELPVLELTELLELLETVEPTELSPLPPPQPNTAPQSIVHMSECTFDRGQRTIGARLSVMRSGQAPRRLRRRARLRIQRCNVLIAHAPSIARRCPGDSRFSDDRKVILT